MLTRLLVKIKHNCPWLWTGVEDVNSWLTHLRYPRAKAVAIKEIEQHNLKNPALRWSLVTPAGAERLSEFLTSLPEERTRYFAAHSFTPNALRRMASGRSFIMLKVEDCASGQIVGYHFLRCFFIGRSFHGLIVFDQASGRGIGTAMWALGAEIAAAVGMTMRATISEHNLPSLRSCQRGTDCTILERMPDGYLLVDCKPRR